MIDRATFDQYVRDALAHLYDPRYLQEHPLARLIGHSHEGARGKVLNRVLLQAIEHLRPPDHVHREAPSWRRYLAVSLRYRDGLSPERVAHELKLSERQARRDHQDGLAGVAAILWDQLVRSSAVVPLTETESHVPTEQEARRGGETIETELLKLEQPHGDLTDLPTTLQATLGLVRSLAAAQNVDFRIAAIEANVPVRVQRTVLRQVLLTLLSHAIEQYPGARIALSVTGGRASATVELTVYPSGGWQKVDQAGLSLRTEAEQLWDAARTMAELYGITIDRLRSAGQEVISLNVPAARTISVLLIDDSADFLRLFRRYLAGTQYQVFSARTPAGALRLAIEARPDVIILDVLMPTQDGWEILTALKGTAATRDIPVVVCSILPERALAYSLGVAAFLPKPVTQMSLLQTLERVVAGATTPASPGA